MENKTPQVMSDDIEQEEVEIIGIHTLCRLCASQNERLIGIFSEEGISNDLSNKINLYLPVKVALGDELPLQCCWNCASTLLAWHELVVTSVETERRFRNSQFISDKQIEDVHFDNPQNPPSDDNIDGSKYELEITYHPLEEDEPEEKPPKPELQAVCHLCHKTVSRARDLKRHISSCHPETVKFVKKPTPAKSKSQRRRRKKTEIVAQFFCDVCEKGFTRKYDMEKHRANSHADHAPIQPATNRNLEVLNKCRNRDSDGKIFYSCDHCKRRFAQSYNLMRHRSIHTGVREFFCHICGKSFRMSNGLSRHIEALHNGVRNFSCEVCKKTFTARSTRDEHMNTHTNYRPFVCDTCGKCFKQKASLHVHKMFHTDVYRFQCSNCGKRFRRKQDLKVHSWLHTGHKPYACQKCKAVFRLRHELTRHWRTHEKVQKCECDECGSVFTQQRYLKVHMKIHAKAESGLTVEVDPLALP